MQQFVAAKLDRIPVVNTNYMDMAGILHELSLLRNEVHCIAVLTEDVSNLNFQSREGRKVARDINKSRTYVVCSIVVIKFCMSKDCNVTHDIHNEVLLMAHPVTETVLQTYDSE